jgi:hypothetical protein
MTARGQWNRQRHNVPRSNNNNSNNPAPSNNNNSNSHRHNNRPSKSNLRESVAAPPRYWRYLTQMHNCNLECPRKQQQQHSNSHPTSHPLRLHPRA